MKFWRKVLTCGLLAVFLVGAWPVAPAAAQSNLLTNSGFEDGFHVQGGAQEVSVANGWTAWWVQGGQGLTNQGYLVRPEYKGEDGQVYGYGRVHGGRYAQKFFNSFSTHDAGLFQTASVPAGSTLQFRAWVQTWSSSSDDTNQIVGSGNYWVSIGIDPAGGINPTAASVVWSQVTFANNRWVQLSVTAQAQGGQVTVFTRGAPQFRVKHNDSYWDDLSLVQIDPAAGPAAPEPAPQPSAAPDSYVVQPGDTLFRIALRFGTTVQELMRLNGLTDPNLIRFGQQLTIRGTPAAPPPQPATGTYTVQPGDTLGEIALRYNTTVTALAALNSILNPEIIFVGQVLTVPGGAVAAPQPAQPRVHVVQPGEMLSTIAARYGVSMWTIAEANNLTNVNFIWVGQRLVIPAN